MVSSIDCFIALETKSPLDKDGVIAWFACVKKNAPSGILATVQSVDDGNGLRSASLICRTQAGQRSYMVPLTRNLTEGEGEQIVAAYEAPEGLEYDIAISSDLEKVQPDAEVITLDDEKYLSLCNAWAKRQHETWMTDRLAGGWT